MHNASFADHMNRWGQLTGGVAEHAAGATFLQPTHENLIRARAEASEAKQRQLRYRAAAQQATRDLEAAMERAHEAASRLQRGLLSYYGDTNLKLVAFGMHPRRVGKSGARVRALEAVAALKGGEAPHRSAEPETREAAPPSARGTSPQAEADAPRAGGDVPQADAEAAALSRATATAGGEAPQAEEKAAARGGTAPPAVEIAPTDVVGVASAGCLTPGASGVSLSVLSAAARAG